ncbi:hypothetical protein ACLBR5_32100 [Escherichia coli]
MLASTYSQPDANQYSYLYIKNVIPAMQMLSDDPKTDSSLRLLEDSLALLTKFENLFSGGGGEFPAVLSELKREKKSEIEKKFPFLSESGRHVANNIPGENNSHYVNKLKSKNIYCNMIAFISGVLMTLFVNYLGNRSRLHWNSRELYLMLFLLKCL